ncbi:MAG: helix-turn-helix domain-containing protein [Pseudodonghicola sp.]|nr:helix-turn-helix domain-containing protein [Pseudodonghicola sp.]
MSQTGYRQFCPVAMAAEVLCTRWTMVLLRELIAGSTRFNELRRGVPRMSPSLLSRRLRELEEAGILTRHPVPDQPEILEYRLTEAGRELRPVIEAFGFWGQRWVESRPSLENLDPSLLMWDMRRGLNPAPLPDRRIVVQVCYPELATSKRDWWLVVEADGTVDLCQSPPGFDVDLYVTTDLRTMTAIWMGLTTVSDAADKIMFDGDPALGRSMQGWLGLSPFAGERKRVP